MLVVFKSEAHILCLPTPRRGSQILSREPSVIYVGRKLLMNYVLGIVTGFSGSNAREVTLKARGQAITTAVDAVGIVRHRLMRDLGIGKIAIGTEEMPAKRRRRQSKDHFNDRNHSDARVGHK